MTRSQMDADRTDALPRIPELAALDREALREVALAHGLDLVVLFGSTARGQRCARSDLDIAVRFAPPRHSRPTPEEEADVEGALLQLFPSPCDLDLVLLNGAAPLLQWNVARHGILLFAASADTWTTYRIRASRIYEDTAKFRRRQWEVLLQRLARDTAK
jgi:predicted nucleotidyltransferase